MMHRVPHIHITKISHTELQNMQKMTLTIISLHAVHTEMVTLYGISPEVEISAMI